MSEKETISATVSVPVELLKRFKLDNHARVLTSAEKELVTLIPKPKPRLVAVTREQWYGDSLTDAEFASLPDLLTLLDEAMESVTERWTVNYTDSRSLSSDLKARIRIALGVYE